MSQNPFTFGNPIKDSNRFFGRKQEIREIVNRLLSSAHESTSIIGEGRMGSTSLLMYLQNREVAENFALTPDLFCLVYLDFQGTELTPARFWNRVLQGISRSLVNPQLAEMTKQLQTREEVDLFDLEDYFDRMKDTGLTTVLLMDEFENITKNQNIRNDFYGGLRALAIHHGLALIPATRSELRDLCSSVEIKGSPFFNIFANITLMPLPMEESEEMVDSYLEKGCLSFSQEDRTFILNMGGGHPYLLQISGYHWFEAKALGFEGDNLYKIASEKIYEQAEPHFRDMWSLFSDNEKLLMVNRFANMSGGKPDEILLSQADISPGFLRSLQKRGLVVKTGEKIGCISPIFEEFLRQQIITSKPIEANRKHSNRGQESQRSLSEYDVFISYSTIDHTMTDAIVAGLEKRGVHCWVAPRDIQPGTTYGQAIITAINECKGMIVIFSSNSNASEQVMQEVERAVSKRMTIIPFRIENVVPTGAMELFLSARQWLDAFEPPLETILEQLADTISTLKRQI